MTIETWHWIRCDVCKDEVTLPCETKKQARAEFKREGGTTKHDKGAGVFHFCSPCWESRER